VNAREQIARAVRGIETQLQGLVAALLPTPERERFARPRELDAPRGSLELGLVQLAYGAGMFVFGGLAFMQGTTADSSTLLIENWTPGLNTTHFQGLGLINWIAWFIYPGSWPFAYLGLVGLTRCTAFAVAREAVGEPVVWAGLRLWQRLRGRAAVKSRHSRLGPLRPDRVLPAKDGDLFVLCCRDKPEWIPAATIEIDDRFYRLVNTEERKDGEWDVIVYRLREQPVESVIRRLVHYRPPRNSPQA
jgi:hypothetical protein